MPNGDLIDVDTLCAAYLASAKELMQRILTEDAPQPTRPLLVSPIKLRLIG